jgi:hypothetical protein
MLPRMCCVQRYVISNMAFLKEGNYNNSGKSTLVCDSRYFEADGKRFAKWYSLHQYNTLEKKIGKGERSGAEPWNLKRRKYSSATGTKRGP